MDGSLIDDVPSLEGKWWLKRDGIFGKFDSKEREVQLSVIEECFEKGKEESGHL